MSLMPGADINLIDGHYYSIGLHPWFIGDDHSEEMKITENFAMKKQVVAIGETGLDKVQGADLNLQLELFEKHIELAEKLSKPLIIHCVRAFNEIARMKKESYSSVPWIIHDFQSNLQIAKQLKDQGMYLSFGKAITRSGSKAEQAFNKIPEESFFLETDDSDITIEKVYTAAAEIRKTNIKEIQEIVKSNFNNCFQIELE